MTVEEKGEVIDCDPEKEQNYQDTQKRGRKKKYFCFW